MSGDSLRAVRFEVPAKEWGLEERRELVHWLARSAPECWRPISAALSNAIPQIQEDTGEQDGPSGPLPVARPQASLRPARLRRLAPDVRTSELGTSNDIELPDQEEAVGPQNRAGSGKKRKKDHRPPSVESSGLSEAPSTNGSSADRTMTEEDHDAWTVDAFSIPPEHHEVVRRFFELSARLDEDVRERLNTLVISLAQAERWQKDHWSHAWDSDETSRIAPIDGTPGEPPQRSTSHTIAALAGLHAKICKRTQFDEAVERMCLVLLRCEIIWLVSSEGISHAAAGERLRRVTGCSSLVDNRRRAKRYTDMAASFGSGILLSLGDNPRRWDKLVRAEYDIVRDFFRTSSDTSLTKKWREDAQVVPQLVIDGLKKLGWKQEAAEAIVRHVLPAAEVSPPSSLLPGGESENVDFCPYDGEHEGGVAPEKLMLLHQPPGDDQIDSTPTSPYLRSDEIQASLDWARFADQTN